MNVAKWLLLGALALPVAELVAIAAVAAAIGLPSALALVVGTSLIGLPRPRQPYWSDTGGHGRWQHLRPAG